MYTGWPIGLFAVSSRKKKKETVNGSSSKGRFTITGAGVISKKSSTYMRSTDGKRQVDAIIKIQNRKSAQSSADGTVIE